MFQSARLKLTAWYVIIIMLISILFSLAIYAGIHNEFRRFEHFQQLRQLREQEGLFVSPLSRRANSFDPEMLAESRRRLILVLVLVNLGILVVSAGASYFLAGRTLGPIKEMVDEQNRFITDASHELRTPLTSLRSEIEVSLRAKNITLPDALMLLKSNLEEVISLQSLSDNLMELAAYQKKNGNQTFEKLSLSEVLEKACKKIVPVAQQKHITVKNDVKDYIVYGDKQSLIELFTILLDNAVKYSRNKTAVNILSKKTDHLISVSVKDEGIGIDKDDQLHIFDRFYRVDKSRSKEMVTGYGLGLSIAQKIVNLHRGTIEVASQLNRGTTFTVKLPFHK